MGPGYESGFPLHCAAASGRLRWIERLLAGLPFGSEATNSRVGLIDCETVGAGVVACVGLDPQPSSGGGAGGGAPCPHTILALTRASVADVNSTDVRTRL